MKRLNNFYCLCGCAILLAVSASAAPLPADWQHEQSFDVSTNGLIKLSLPVQTLDAARPALEDLRLYDDSGKEVSYVIDRPMPVAKTIRSAKSFQVSLNANTTVITLETGMTQPFDAITLETPERDFIKAARVESSNDGKSWQTLVQGQPVFRQIYGASHLQISFPATVAKFARLTIDDQRSQPIPFTAARIHAATGESAPTEWTPVEITERDENPGETRLALNLGAANLNIASVQIETTEPLFMREITFAVPQVSENSIHEQVVGGGTAYRVAVEGQTPAEKLSVPLETMVRSRELLLLISNGDSQPLPITGVRIERRPVYLVFLARQTGKYHLLTGNSHSAAPHYDLASLGINLKNVDVSPIKLLPPAKNPDYRAPEVLAGVDVAGAPLDISKWKFRKPIKISRSGAQQIELDLDVVSHVPQDFSDLRVELGSNQVPYIIERTSISRAINPTISSGTDAKDPKLSRWTIKLPLAGLPLTRLNFASQTPLFERSFSLYEELADQRGEKYRRSLNNASWRQTPDRKSKEFSLALENTAQSDTLVLETSNGDNPPIELEKFQIFYPVTRILFKAKADDKLFLYYGNPQVPAPHYDLSLVADQLLSAEKNVATLGGEEQLKKSSWQENQVPGKGGVIFWGILAIVVVVLLVVISRLLPKAPPAQ